MIYLNRIQLGSNRNVVPTVYQLNFNYKRNRFFPSVCYNKISILNSSLGIISKYFDTKKSFLKSKSSYILSILYIKRLLLSIPIYKLNLNVVRIPIYLKDMVNRLLSKDKVYLENPFIKNQYVTYNKSLQISFIYFIGNKPFGKLKYKKSGRLKRKIRKKIIMLNSIKD